MSGDDLHGVCLTFSPRKPVSLRSMGGLKLLAQGLQRGPHLQPLPAALFPCYHEARRSVSRDSFVEVQRAFYEAPLEYIGRQVWVHWDSHCVRIFNDRLEQVQIHLRVEPGRFSRLLGVAGMSAPVLSSCRRWIGRAALLGEAYGRWAQTSVDRRGPGALRSIKGLCHLANKHTAATIAAALQKALKAAARRLKDSNRSSVKPGPQDKLRHGSRWPSRPLTGGLS